jgi:hypothetical protein
VPLGAAGVSFFSALAEGANFSGADMSVADLEVRACCVWVCVVVWIFEGAGARSRTLLHQLASM